MPSPSAARSRSRPASTSPRLLIRSSAIHAAGCYTLDPIARGRRILEYDGPRIPKELADERYSGRPVTYLFGFGDKGEVIDGFGAAMFINHSCAPNCETEEADSRIFIRAIRDIAAGEELVYEYNLYDSDEDNADCFCGAPGCRRTMFSDAELKRRARLAKRKSSPRRNIRV
ncbi:MAG TPA: SET domain-containing protein-lysine N-methyltransferase [Acidobacteriaceae bacterium]|jgi:SET domain-containing protein|nr:SET domain-containing protein-lysine N-methyltransferase [Acidobacteriaceae bacterium]